MEDNGTWEKGCWWFVALCGGEIVGYRAGEMERKGSGIKKKGLRREIQKGEISVIKKEMSCDLLRLPASVLVLR